MSIEAIYGAAMIVLGVMGIANILFQLARIFWTGTLPSPRTFTGEPSASEASRDAGE